jgi:hypothetical protein
MILRSLSTLQIKSILAGIAAVAAFLVAQPDVVLPPIVKVAFGGLIVFLAVVNPEGAKPE